MKVVCVQVSLVQALVPRDEADEHSAILEVRAGGCRGGGGHMQDDYKIAAGTIITQLSQAIASVIGNCSKHTGAGGQEASLFAAEIFLMYQK